VESYCLCDNESSGLAHELVSLVPAKCPLLLLLSVYFIQIQTPSGSKILVRISSWSGVVLMNLDIYLYERLRTNGLCGEFGGGNLDNNVKNRVTNQRGHIGPGHHRLLDLKTSESWRCI